MANKQLRHSGVGRIKGWKCGMPTTFTWKSYHGALGVSESAIPAAPIDPR